MNKLMVAAFVLSVSCFADSMKGITETGDEVILRDDGTWIYVSPDTVEKEVIEINPENIKSVPTMSKEFNTKFLHGIHKQNDNFILLLDVDKVFTESEIDLIKDNALIQEV